jgi:hypothetical protein
VTKNLTAYLLENKDKIKQLGEGWPTWKARFTLKSINIDGLVEVMFSELAAEVTSMVRRAFR